MSLAVVLSDAFGVPASQVKWPAWIRDGPKIIIEAAFRPDANKDQVRRMLQRLLLERFHLAYHWESHEVHGFALAVDQPGAKVSSENNLTGGASAFSGDRVLTGPKTLDDLAGDLSSRLQMPVVNLTRLQGVFNFALRWDEDGAPSDTPYPSLRTALREQLGLKLSPALVDVKTLVVDHMDQQPTEQ